MDLGPTLTGGLVRGRNPSSKGEKTPLGRRPGAGVASPRATIFDARDDGFPQRPR